MSVSSTCANRERQLDHALSFLFACAMFVQMDALETFTFFSFTILSLRRSSRFD